MRHRSPSTGRFMSKAVYRRWYAKGKPKHNEYRRATRKRKAKKRGPQKRQPERKGFKRGQELIVKIISTRKSRKGGSHLTFLDIRLKLNRKATEQEIINELRSLGSGAEIENPIFEVAVVSWQHGEQEAREGSAEDLSAFGAMLEAPGEPIRVEEEELP